ncbi:MAG: helix-turn-helix domain-containing protein [Streptosporangiaceae bacterium]|nr:helix-turn-helix domain-containing protein [Streptosporangiaceae bacterium]MBV9856216.1 helix-turn-helix domain-containing protein [Streptosporangiaceae bacterium]
MTPAARPAPPGSVACFPRQLTAAMRAELPGAAEEIITEIRRAIPEYARPMKGPYGEALRMGVGQALTTFVDLMADPSTPCAGRDEVCRRLGQYEAYEGRSLDSLQAAYRIGAQVSWRRIMKLGQRNNLTSTVMSLLAEAVFRYMDELAALSLEGYQEAQARSGEARQEWRRRLLRLIHEQPPAPRRAITNLAGLAGWTVPETVTPVALRPPAEPGGAYAPDARAAGQQPDVRLPDTDVLSDLSCPQPHLLVPGPVTETRELMLKAAVAGRPAAIGLTVPLPAAANSLRWARQALSLGESGVLADSPVVRCEDHLVTLWLLSDTALADHVVRGELGMLARLTPRQRSRVTDTLGPWLETRGTATEIAELLNVHPQTVRYRIRQFERTFGDRLNDPDARFALELALRVMRLTQR